MSMKEILYQLFDYQYLTREQAREVLFTIVKGDVPETQISSLITSFLMRSISVDEILGFRDARLEMRVQVDLTDYEPLDIVGTGGDGKNTFNISTTACFVVAGAGYPVVKHGNYGATSISGASNVIESLGVRFTTDSDQLRRSLDACGLAYLHAPLFSPARSGRGDDSYGLIHRRDAETPSVFFNTRRLCVSAVKIYLSIPRTRFKSPSFFAGFRPRILHINS